MASKVVSARVSGDLLGRIQRLAEKRGLSTSQYAEELLLLGVSKAEERDDDEQWHVMQEIEKENRRLRALTGKQHEDDE